MNVDLKLERKNASFQVEKITHILDGSPDRTSRRRELENIIRNDPSGIFDNSNNNYLHRTDRHVRAMAKGVRMLEIARKIGIGAGDKKSTIRNGPLEEGELMLSEDFFLLVNAVADELPLYLHWVMFVPNIRSLGDDEQQKLWLPLCRDFRMIGCYAQTELGHGSNVRALETTATFISEAEGGGKDGSWKIHSPTLTSSKFWPGTLGRTANTAMVIARLIDGDKVDRGIHNFLVPLRNSDTHKMLPGVTVGDIGPKIGYNNMDNGFAIFNNVIIPRRNMAMRFASVDKHGKYLKKSVDEATSKVAYITMMLVRAWIVDQAGKSLAFACTITTRYSAVRRQGFDETQPKVVQNNGITKLKPEKQVLDYTQQQHRIFPLIAASYCFFFTGRHLMKYLQHIENQLVSGTGSVTKTQVSDLHASSSSLKSLCTIISADGIEECRKACGGHGFLVSSGLPELLTSYLQNPTVEGDNHMLPQQSVHVLLKLVQVVSEGDEDGIMAYEKCDSKYLIKPMQRILSGDKASCTAQNLNEIMDLDLLLEAYQHRSARLLLEVAHELQTKIGEGTKMNVAWNELLVEMARMSRAHAYAILLSNFIHGIKEVQSDPKLSVGKEEVEVLTDCAYLFAVYYIEKDLGDFLEDSYLEKSQTSLIRKAVLHMLSKIRSNAVALVDSWDFSDFRLKSALGRNDGNVYPAILEAAKKDPLNATNEGPGYVHLKKLYVDGVAKYDNFSGTASRL